MAVHSNLLRVIVISFLFQEVKMCSQVGTYFICQNAFLNTFPQARIAPNTTHIDLSNNKIDRLNETDFVNLPNLVSLNVENNVISSIDENAFCGSANLSHLYLAYNKFRNIPYLNCLHTLQTLDLSANIINKANAKFPVSFKSMTQLKNLTLAKNALKEITRDNLANLHHSSIEILNLNEIGLETIDNDVFLPFNKLTELDLSTNRLLTTSDLKTAMDSLRNATHMKILLLEEIVKDYDDILPDTFQGLSGSSIEYFSLAGSEINTLASNTFSPLKSLRVLNLARTAINVIEDGALLGLDQLEHLDMTGPESPENQQVKWIIPNNFFPETLIYLNLNERNLSTINHGTFENLKELRNLSLRNCQLTQFHSKVLPAGNLLRYLDISHSKFSTCLPKLSDLSNLEYLDISHSFLGMNSNINILLDNLTKLSHLIMEDNNFNIITYETVKNVLSLHYFSLANNQIAGLVNWQISMWKNKVVIDLRNNELRCDCYLQWFRSWIDVMEHDNNTNVTFVDYKNYMCGGLMSGKKMIDVPEFKCEDPRPMQIIFSGVCISAIFLFVIIAYGFINRWYIRWHLYKLSHRRSKYNNDEERNLRDKQYDIYMSNVSSNQDIADQIVSHLEMPLQEYIGLLNESACSSSLLEGLSNKTIDTDIYAADINALIINELSHDETSTMAIVNEAVSTQTDQQANEINQNAITIIGDVQVDSNPSECSTSPYRYMVYYESRDSQPGEWVIKGLVEAIYSSRNVVVCLSCDYLKDRRRKFELRLILKAMTERYGSSAHKHIVFVMLLDAKEVSDNLLPNQFHGCTILRWPTSGNPEHLQFYQRLRASL